MEQPQQQQPRITLEVLQGYYHLPLVEVAKELNVSLTMLKKLCRKLNIQRWPHRQIRSINNTIQELRERPLSTIEERREMDGQIALLEKKKRLVSRGASSGLQAALRNVLFLASPEDIEEETVDEMMNKLQDVVPPEEKKIGKGKNVLLKMMMENNSNPNGTPISSNNMYNNSLDTHNYTNMRMRETPKKTSLSTLQAPVSMESAWTSSSVRMQQQQQQQQQHTTEHFPVKPVQQDQQQGQYAWQKLLLQQQQQQQQQQQRQQQVLQQQQQQLHHHHHHQQQQQQQQQQPQMAQLIEPFMLQPQGSMVRGLAEDDDMGMSTRNMAPASAAETLVPSLLRTGRSVMTGYNQPDFASAWAPETEFVGDSALWWFQQQQQQQQDQQQEQYAWQKLLLQQQQQPPSQPPPPQQQQQQQQQQHHHHQQQQHQQEQQQLQQQQQQHQQRQLLLQQQQHQQMQMHGLPTLMNMSALQPSHICQDMFSDFM